MNLTVSFSWAGLVVFTLPMLINIAYVLFPPVEKTEPAAVTRWVELWSRAAAWRICWRWCCW